MTDQKSLPDAPVEIPYKRWRHKARGYVVNVIEVSNTLGNHGYLTYVRVEGKGQKPRIKTWPAQAFLEAFEPVVKRRVMTRYQRITKKDRD